MITYPSRVRRGFDLVLTANSRRVLLHEPQSTNQQSADESEFPHRAGRYQPGGTTVFVPGVLGLHMYGRSSDPGIRHCPPRVPWASMLSRRSTLAGRWLHEPQRPSRSAISRWGGVSTRARRYRPGGSPYASWGCWSSTCAEGFPTRGSEFILPGYGGTSTLSRGAEGVNSRRALGP